MMRIRKFRKSDGKRLKEIAPKAFMVYARFGIDKTLPRDKTRRNYRKEVEGYIAEVGTDQNNIAAIRTYEKNGFRVIYSGITLSQWL